MNLTGKTIDVIQWVLVILLLILLVVQGVNYNSVKKQLVVSEEYNRQNTYVRIYESQKLEKLKKENKELYDSISKLSNVESGMIIKFKEHYITDTVKVEKFKVKHDTVYKSVEQNIVDSVYHYAQSNDTIDCDIQIKAKDLEWCLADITIRDKFVIINREKDGVNQTIINHSDNTEIEETTMWHKQTKKKWYEKFSVGPQVGVGYGTFGNKFDVYVGVGASYNLSK